MIPTKLNPSQIAQIRNLTLKQIRSHFDERNFIEIDAPLVIAANAVEAFIDPIAVLEHDPAGNLNVPKFLITSPELHMKRLLAHGLERIYFLGHVFRDKEASPIHKTEFLMLEWYQARTTLNEVISNTETLFASISSALKNHAQITFSEPFERLSVASAWAQFAQIDLAKALHQISLGDPDALTKAVIASGETLRDNATFDDAFTHIMVKKVEPNIGKDRPCVLFDWPAQTAALARLSDTDPLFAQRFEIYCHGIELANAFAELTDADEQRQRFVEANQTRVEDRRSLLPIDENFINDLRKMPPACGIALGIDRLIALITGRRSLKDILCLQD